ncbi:MAG: 23S rRNA (adenine(2503)-C(2))-methyltransferase RlmN [Cytophagales bacterium]|nr:MAG: 23S rRNA (adenine(2503)-C(2))-methyltransferase RlmN [Cytophagales bacterium]
MDRLSTKIDIRKLDLEQLKQLFVAQGEQGFRAKQLHEWLWKKSATSFEQMSNLSAKIRNFLAENYEINSVTIANKQLSNDRTIKSGFRLYDNHLVEGVLIPTNDRMTACVSSQVGCSLTCKFCATGYMDRKRNLEAAEIYDQVVLIKQQAEEHYQIPLSNIVYMGMGEPLLNYANVVQSIQLITQPDGLGMSPKRITVSTAGIAKMIKKLADEDLGVNLALSLHAANDVKRDKIMPINETNTLEALKDALSYWYEKTGIRVTLEYILLYNVNDTLEDAQELYEFWKSVKSKVNIIEFNPIAEADFKKTEAKTLDKFINFLEAKGVIVNVRRSRGKDIDAACGQLAIKTKETQKSLE